MKKSVYIFVMMFLVLTLFLSINFVSAEINKSKLDSAEECLETEVDDCTGLTVEEMVFVILSDSDVADDCFDILETKKDSDEDCYGDGACTIKETALAILALDHEGKDTDDAEDWLLEQNKTSKDLDWLLQQDSNVETECKFSYDAKDYSVTIREDKKIESDAGSCLNRVNSDFWFEVSPNCYDTEFAVSCDEEFIANLLYRSDGSNELFVLSNTPGAAAYGTINLKIKSSCFSTTSICNYEDNLWAVLALKKIGYDEVEDYLPYLIALAESNERYMPYAFIYMVTEDEEYATRLIKQQELGNYWEGGEDTPSAYNKFYDTALALLSLSDSIADEVIKAQNWVFFSQDRDGCWNNKKIQDTAIMIWALNGWTAGGGGGNGGNGGTPSCKDSDFFCIDTAECPTNEVLNNYFCSGFDSVCCKNENLKACSELNGVECSSDETCSSVEKRTVETDYCCLGTCNPRATKSECDKIGYTCKSTCADNQEEVDYACDSGNICCKAKTTPTPGPKSYWWIWLLIIGILAVLAVLAFMYREHLKVWYAKMKEKMKKGKGGSGSGRPGYPYGGPGGRPGMPPGPGRPGFPPIRRPMPLRQSPQPRPGRPPANDKEDDVFSRLKNMSK